MGVYYRGMNNRARDGKLLYFSDKRVGGYQLNNSSLATVIITTISWLYGASVTQWPERSPFTSEVADSIFRENFVNVTQSQCSTHVKRVCQHSAESREFSPSASVSSHKEVDRMG